MSNVIELPVITTLPIPCERILRKATEADLKEVFVIGTRQDGSLYFSSSFGDGGNVLWLMEKAKFELMKITGDL